MDLKLISCLVALAVFLAAVLCSGRAEAAGQADKWKSQADCEQVGRFLCQRCCQTFGGQGRMKKLAEHRVQTQCQCS